MLCMFWGFYGICSRCRSTFAAVRQGNQVNRRDTTPVRPAVTGIRSIPAPRGETMLPFNIYSQYMFILNLKRLAVFEILHLRLGCWRENALRFSSYSVHLNAGILVTSFHSLLTNLYNFHIKNQCLIFRKNKKQPSWSRLFACQRWLIDWFSLITSGRVTTTSH